MSIHVVNDDPHRSDESKVGPGYAFELHVCPSMEYSYGGTRNSSADPLLLRNKHKKILSRLFSTSLFQSYETFST